MSTPTPTSGSRVPRGVRKNTPDRQVVPGDPFVVIAVGRAHVRLKTCGNCTGSWTGWRAPRQRRRSLGVF